MANIFPRWSNLLPLKIAVCAGFTVAGIALALTYYATPKTLTVGYQPTQPIPFSHKIHVDQVGLDCRYCHSFVDVSGHSNVPTGNTCWNNPEEKLRPLDQITNLNYKPEQLDRAGFYDGLLKKGIKAEEIAGTIEPGKNATQLDEILALASGKYGEKVTQLEVGTQLKKHWQVQPPENCTTCHR